MTETRTQRELELAADLLDDDANPAAAASPF
jgi:hypothetical protein